MSATAVQTPSRTLVSIQYLRALAALSVALYHAFQRAWVEGMAPTELQDAAAGVDVFFVLSGFVMWASTEASPASPLEFLRRRLVRVAPAYWIATLVAAALVLTWPWVFQEVKLGDWRHLLLSLLFVPHADPRGLPFPVLQQGWTLNYEALFYAVFALGLFLPSRLRIAWLAMSLGAVWLWGEVWPPAYTYIANPILMEFLAGVALAELWRRGRLKGRIWSWLAILYGLAMLILLQALDYRSDAWRPLLWGGPATLIVGGAVALEASGWGRPWPWLQRLGDASYSIYLVHAFPTAVLIRTGGFTSAWLFVPAAMALVVATGVAARLLIEKPLLRLLHGKTRPRLAGDDPSLEDRTRRAARP
ncbi:MAG: acyltransferase [Proteobacteria bacterium]|nr:acyltransferase [Pseudomonadota bacterium]